MDVQQLPMALHSIEATIQRCSELIKPVPKYVEDARLILVKWETEVKTKSEVQVYVYGHNQYPPSVPYRMFQPLQKEVDKVLQEVERLWRWEIHDRLATLVTMWKTTQLHRWQGRRPLTPDPPDLSQGLERLCETVNALLKRLVECATCPGFEKVDSLLREKSHQSAGPVSPWLSQVLSILEDAWSLLLVIQEQPPPVLVIEPSSKSKEPPSSASSSDGARNPRGRPQSSGRKAAAAAKKTTPSTSVGILGGRGFGGGVVITDMTIGLGLGSDLAKYPPCRWALSDLRKIHGTPVDGKGWPAYEKTLEDLKLQHFSRGEKDVWKWLYHAVYFVTVAVQGLPCSCSSFQFQILSFPLMVTSASTQKSKFLGAHLWHSFSSQNVYDLSKKIQPSLKVGEVIRMLEQRLRGISSRRELRNYERHFLQQKLERAVQEAPARRPEAGVDMITLDIFVTQPVTMHCPERKLKFSFWIWWHAAANLLEHTLLKPWSDGTIYGFASVEQCTVAMANEPTGTFLFRFSESVLKDNHLMSQGYLNAMIKTEDKVVAAGHIGAKDVKTCGLVYRMKHTCCENLFGTSLTKDQLQSSYPPTEPDPYPSRYLHFNDPKIQASNLPKRILTGKRRIHGSDDGESPEGPTLMICQSQPSPQGSFSPRVTEGERALPGVQVWKENGSLLVRVSETEERGSLLKERGSLLIRVWEEDGNLQARVSQEIGSSGAGCGSSAAAAVVSALPARGLSLSGAGENGSSANVQSSPAISSVQSSPAMSSVHSSPGVPSVVHSSPAMSSVQSSHAMSSVQFSPGVPSVQFSPGVPSVQFSPGVPSVVQSSPAMFSVQSSPGMLSVQSSPAMPSVQSSRDAFLLPGSPSSVLPPPSPSTSAVPAPLPSGGVAVRTRSLCASSAVAGLQATSVGERLPPRCAAVGPKPGSSSSPSSIAVDPSLPRLPVFEEDPAWPSPPPVQSSPSGVSVPSPAGMGQSRSSASSSDQFSGQGGSSSGQGDLILGRGGSSPGQGDPFLGQGGSSSGQGDPFWGQGGSSSGQGDPFLGQGSQFSGQGGSSSGQGDPFWGQGWGQGDPYSGQSDPRVTLSCADLSRDLPDATVTDVSEHDVKMAMEDLLDPDFMEFLTSSL